MTLEGWYASKKPNQKSETYQKLPFRTKVDLRVMAIKGHSAISKAPVLLELRHQIVLPLCKEAVGVF